jgi:hypothetical protein
MVFKGNLKAILDPGKAALAEVKCNRISLHYSTQNFGKSQVFSVFLALLKNQPNNL